VASAALGQKPDVRSDEDVRLPSRRGERGSLG